MKTLSCRDGWFFQYWKLSKLVGFVTFSFLQVCVLSPDPYFHDFCRRDDQSYNVFLQLLVDYSSVTQACFAWFSQLHHLLFHSALLFPSTFCCYGFGFGPADQHFGESVATAGELHPWSKFCWGLALSFALNLLTKTAVSRSNLDS